MPDVQTLTDSVDDGDDYLHHSEEQTDNQKATGLPEVTELITGPAEIWRLIDTSSVLYSRAASVG